MKISLIITVLNEQKTIGNLLQSIELQSRKPDEVVIVDAGSTDQTINIIKNSQKHSSLRIRLFKKHGNRAVGRNYAVKHAVGQGIAATDAGCVLDKHWLKLITAPLINHKADVVAGFYRMTTDSFFTQCSAPFFGVTSHNLDTQTFLPSSRSIAFTKKAWAKVGGYPESLDYAEDLVFAQKIKDDKNLKMLVESKAIVEWSPPADIFSFFSAIKHYTIGNVQAGYHRHLVKNYLVAIRYALFAVLLFIFFSTHNPLILILLITLIPIYFLYTTVKFAPHLHHPLSPNLLFILQLIADVAVVTGLALGLVKLWRAPTLQTRSRPAGN